MRSITRLTCCRLLQLVVIPTETHGALGNAYHHVLVVPLVELLTHAVLYTHVGSHLVVLSSAVAEDGVIWRESLLDRKGRIF